MRIVTGVTRLGWIGTGVMGSQMAGRLLDAGFSVCVHSRTQTKARTLLERGAGWAASPEAVAASSDVVFTMVGLPADVREVGLGERGVLRGLAPGAVWVDMTTSEASLAVEIAEQAAQKGGYALDAPVSGGDVGARDGTLSIMIGGDADVARALEPCWRVLGKTFVHQGGPGAGQHTKLVNQILVASSMIGVCEALVYASRAGLDLASVLRSVSTGAAGSWTLANLAPRMIAGDFAPGFMVEHFVKDMGLALAEAERLRIALPGLSLVKQLYAAVQARGEGRLGTQALIKVLAGLSGLTWQGPPA
jgi:3-hydroxyisobutyrate dehydrogenase